MNEFRTMLVKRIALLLVAGAAGLAGGVLVGRGTRIASDASREASHVAGVAVLPGRADDAARRASPASDADDRIARLFTALKEPIDLAKRHELREALRGFPASEFPRLVERAEKVPADLKSDLLTAVMIAWCDADPAAANRWMLDHPDWSWGVEAWARKNPEDAIRDALAAPGRDRSKRALFSAIEKLAGKKGPAAMVARLRELPAGELRDSVFGDVLDRWAKSDPAAAFAAAAELAPGAGRNEARKKVVLAWAERDPAAALGQIPSMLSSLDAGVLGSTFLAQLAESVMKKNPRLALDWLGKLPPEHRTSAAVAGLGSWAQTEPVAALEWCLANDVPPTRGRWFTVSSWGASVLGNAIQHAPAATLAWLESRPAGPERDSLIERALWDSGWNAQGSLPSPEEERARQRLLQQLPPAGQVAVAQAFGLQAGSAGDFTDLDTWAQRFQPGRARTIAVGAAIDSAYSSDAARADKLLATVSAGADRDEALRVMSRISVTTTPASAAARAAEIGDPAKRREALDVVVGAWLKRDPEATRTWLREATTIPAAWKAKWLP